MSETNEYATRYEVVPGVVVKVTWWNGNHWYVTHEARPAGSRQQVTVAQCRCPVCGVDIDAGPASRADGHWEGSCPEHGLVIGDTRERLQILNDPRCSRCGLAIEIHESGMCDSCEMQEHFERVSEGAI